MKPKFVNSAPLLAAILALGLADHASAAAINVDIQGTGGSSLGTYSGTAVPTTGTTWNGVTFDGTKGPLVDDAGAATDIQMYFDANLGEFAYNPPGDPAAELLMGDYAFINNAGGTSNILFTIFTNAADGGTGLAITSGSVWDIYIYATGDSPTHGGSFLLNDTTTLATTGSGPWNGSFVEGANYVKFSSVSPVAYNASPTNNGFEFRVVWSDLSGQQFSGFNGIQIVQVPEPGTAAAFLGGCGLLLTLRRRRRILPTSAT